MSNKQRNLTYKERIEVLDIKIFSSSKDIEDLEKRNAKLTTKINWLYIVASILGIWLLGIYI